MDYIEKILHDSNIQTNDIIGIITVVIGVFTIRYLRSSWKETNKQTYLQSSPFLNIYIDDSNKVYLKNSGKSPAFNIKIDRIYFILDFMDEVTLINNDFEEIDILESGEKIQIKIYSTHKGEEISLSFIDHLNPRFQEDFNYKLNIRYTNSLSKRYITTLQAGKDGLRFLDDRQAKFIVLCKLWVQKQYQLIYFRYYLYRFLFMHIIHKYIK